MSQPAAYHRAYTVEEYLDLEEESLERHEYVAGGIHALAGATKRHNRIVLNLATNLIGLVEAGPCRVYVLDVKLRAGADLIYYPDLMVSCGPARDPLIEDAPSLIIEVASPSTEVVDRREKLLAYKRISTLQAYFIVKQDEMRVVRHWRDDAGSWWQAELDGVGVLPIPHALGELSLEQIYAGVDFEK